MHFNISPRETMHHRARPNATSRTCTVYALGWAYGLIHGYISLFRFLSPIYSIKKTLTQNNIHNLATKIRHRYVYFVQLVLHCMIVVHMATNISICSLMIWQEMLQFCSCDYLPFRIMYGFALTKKGYIKLAGKIYSNAQCESKKIKTLVCRER